MRTCIIIRTLYILALLSVKPSSSDQPLWLLYPQLMDNAELDQAKTNAATINIDIH
jgi:hypothetical protein